MTDIVSFAAEIDRMEASGNFMRVFFICPKRDMESIKKSFEDLKMPNIIQNKITKMNGTTVYECMFELEYLYSAQKFEIDDLMVANIRMKALKQLYNMGGIKIKPAERAYFKALDAWLAQSRQDKTW